VKGYRAAIAPLIMPSLLPLLLTAVSCGSGTPAASAQRLWSMADLQRAFEGAGPCDNPAGLPCNYLVDRGVNGNEVLQFKLAFSEGEPMGYITTDFWSNYTQIWLEPMYILVTAWNDKAPKDNRLLDENGVMTGPIFSIGPQSAFWSPFWQVFYVVVPVGTPSTKYTSVRQLFDDHLVMHPGPNRYASIGPANVSLPMVSDITLPTVAPTVADYLDNGAADVAKIPMAYQTLSGWLDGARVNYVDFGTDNFDVDATGAIQDVPLFLFKTYGPDGGLQFAGAPNVGGVAPLFSHLSGRIGANERPQFGALWRLHIVTLPPSAKIFSDADAMTAASNGGDPAVYKAKVNRVVLKDCVGSITATTDTCVYLDSQRAIEDNLGPKAIERTNFQPACPFVMWSGVPVPYQ